jgi:hypothetical protein
MIEKILLLVACHLLGDFPFQSDWLALNKGKSWEVLLYHCAIYTATFVIFAHVGWPFALFLFTSHMLIDSLKARWHVVKTVWQDQLLHAAVIAIGLLMHVV